MHRPLVLVGLLLAGTAVHSFGTTYRQPSIYTPIAGQNDQNAVFYPGPMLPRPSALLNFYQNQPYPLYPPNSLILVYYRSKSRNPLPEAPIQQHPQLALDVCKGEGVTAHPNDCFKFLRCKLSANQQVFFYEVRTCPSGLAFDTTLETCNYHSRVSTCATLQTSPSRGIASTKTSTKSSRPPFPTQTLLTYHNDLPTKSVTDNDNSKPYGEVGHTSPSLYMLDLPSSLSSEGETPKQELGVNKEPSTLNTSESSVASEKPKADSTAQVVKKPSSVPKSPKNSSRKVSTKSSAKSSSTGKSSLQSQSQASKALQNGKKPRVETFSISDPSESAKMVLAKEDAIEEAAHVPAEPVPEQASEVPSGDKLVSGVSYEEDDQEAEGGDSADNYASSTV